MEDIAPSLYEQLKKIFENNLSKDTLGKRLLDKIREGNGTYTDAGEYAEVLGKALSDALKEILSPDILPNGQVYWNIADRVLRPLLESDYKMAADTARQVQDWMNKRAGIGIKAQAAQLPQGRVDGILNVVSSGAFENRQWILEVPLQTFCRTAVDDTLLTNVDFQRRAGLNPKIIRRTTGKCCDTCARLAGIYKYPEETFGIQPSVFWRHNSCRCVVEYDPDDGSGLRENVHTKQWTTDKETAKMEARKLIGLRTNGVAIKNVSNHAMDRIQERSILPDSLIDTLQHPLKIGEIKTDEKGNTSFTVIGKKATAVINPQNGTLVTAYPTHKKQARKLMRGK